MGVCLQPFQRLCRFGLCIGFPVHIGIAPEQGAVAAFLCRLQRRLGVFPAGTPEILHFIAVIVQHILVQIQNLCLCLGFGQRGQAGVGHAVVAQNVSLRNHAVHKVSFLFGVVAGEEKDGAHLFFFQRVQDLSGIAVFIALVKGQKDAAAVGCGGIGAVLRILCVECHGILRTVFTVHGGSLSIADHFAADGADRSHREQRHCQQTGQQAGCPTIFHLHSPPLAAFAAVGSLCGMGGNIRWKNPAGTFPRYFFLNAALLYRTRFPRKTPGRCGLLSLGKSAVAISAGQRAGHRPLLYRGQRPGLLALVLASIFEKLLDRKTLLSGAVFHHVYVSP